MPDGGPFRVPGADGVVFGFGLGARLEGPGMGEAAPGIGGRVMGMTTAEDDGIAIVKMSGGH